MVLREGAARLVDCVGDEALEPLAFDTIYGHHFDRVISAGGKHVLKISVERYLKAIGSPRG